MKMSEINHLNRRQQDRFQPPNQPLEWEVRKRRAGDFIPPDEPLDWSEMDQPNHQPES